MSPGVAVVAIPGPLEAQCTRRKRLPRAERCCAPPTAGIACIHAGRRAVIRVTLRPPLTSLCASAKTLPPPLLGGSAKGTLRDWNRRHVPIPSYTVRDYSVSCPCPGQQRAAMRCVENVCVGCTVRLDSGDASSAVQGAVGPIGEPRGPLVVV